MLFQNIIPITLVKDKNYHKKINRVLGLLTIFKGIKYFRRERLNMKNIQSLDLTRKEYFKALTWKVIFCYKMKI